MEQRDQLQARRRPELRTRGRVRLTIGGSSRVPGPNEDSLVEDYLLRRRARVAVMGECALHVCAWTPVCACGCMWVCAHACALAFATTAGESATAHLLNPLPLLSTSTMS
jgi:hypothetical protein